MVGFYTEMASKNQLNANVVLKMTYHYLQRIPNTELRRCLDPLGAKAYSSATSHKVTRPSTPWFNECIAYIAGLTFPQMK